MNKEIYILVFMVILLVLFMIGFGRSSVKEIKKMPKFIFWKLIYSDMYDASDSEELSGILYSSKYDLQGKPDMIYRHRITKEILPVEIKSGQTEYPHNGDLLQVGAYMLIVEDICGRMPKKAILSYKNKTFVVRNTHLLRNNVLDTADRMRKMLISGEEEPNADFATCRHCVCDQTVCEYSFNNK